MLCQQQGKNAYFFLSKKSQKTGVKNAGQWVVFFFRRVPPSIGAKAVHTAAVMQVT